jgi:predicted nucleic acid-binding Zn ribbon protein
MADRRGQSTFNQVLANILQDKQLSAGLRRAMAMNMWPRIVGKDLAKHSWPENVIDGTMHVCVSTHPWASELQNYQKEILERYARSIGKGFIRALHFRVGRRYKRIDTYVHQSTNLFPGKDVKLDIQPADDLVANIKNEEVREMLKKSFARMRAAREWKIQQGWKQCPVCTRFYNAEKCPFCR